MSIKVLVSTLCQPMLEAYIKVLNEHTVCTECYYFEFSLVVCQLCLSYYVFLIFCVYLTVCRCLTELGVSSVYKLSHITFYMVSEREGWEESSTADLSARRIPFGHKVTGTWTEEWVGPCQQQSSTGATMHLCHTKHVLGWSTDDGAAILDLEWRG